MRRLLGPTAAALIAAALTAGLATGGRNGNAERLDPPYAIGLWGDLPYSDLQAEVGVPNLIADMNTQNLAFTAHDGDIKNGSDECTNAVYAQALAYFNSLQSAAVFTPGDNDWTDCDPPYSSLERLDYERQLFFSTPYTLGQHPLQQEVQATPLCLGASGDTPCVENRRWAVGGVTYATLDIVGSCNNLCGVEPDPAEYAARNQANIAWMRETFDAATATDSAAIMFISQANPGWDRSDPMRAPQRNPRTLAETDGQPDGFQDFLLALRQEVITFKRPVVYVHGDSHYFRIDKPFLDSQGRRLLNFTRLETFGDNAANGNNDAQWVKVLVDVQSRGVFSYQPRLVPKNRIEVTSPGR